MSQELHRRAVALYNRACELQQRPDLQGAIALYDEALALDPNLAAAYSNRGAAFAAMNRCDDALASLDRAIGLKPDYAEAHFCRAVALLMRGELPAGWKEFEWRWKTAPGRALWQAKNFLQPPWLGEEAVAGRAVLLYSERGLGDTLQFCRYALLVSQLHAKVILQVQAPLVALMRSLSDDIQVVSESEPLPHFDLHCSLLSLPLVFKTSVLTIPAPRRYLSADVADVERLRARLTPRAAARVGLVWRGDANNPDDRHRSIGLREVLPCLPAGLHYFSLQKEITPEERNLIEAHASFTCLSSELGFEATAALCECLDVVIAIDTSVAHLAAALGVRTWILLPFNADCRWLLGRADSPWYPTVTLYRQRKGSDWRDVLARVRADLERPPRRERL
jgi:TPR repeat/Glycosyltransferase family 9 (heptosyltransferase)